MRKILRKSNEVGPRCRMSRNIRGDIAIVWRYVHYQYACALIPKAPQNLAVRTSAVPLPARRERHSAFNGQSQSPCAAIRLAAFQRRFQAQDRGIFGREDSLSHIPPKALRQRVSGGMLSSPFHAFSMRSFGGGAANLQASTLLPCRDGASPCL